jgi:uncharacterized membrane protein
MKKNEFVTLCLKIMGLYFILMGIINLPHLLSCLTQTEISRWDFFVSPLLYFICGIILFFKATAFTRFIVNLDTDKESDIQFELSDNTIRIALQIMGFYILAQGIPGFCQILANSALYYFEVSSIPKYLQQQQQHFIYLVGPTTQILLGLWLIIGSRRIMYYIQLLRHD